jgi:SHS2 domain-containing protein
MGFVEIEHTADCAIRVWAADLTTLFVEAARGMNHASGAEVGNGPRVERGVLIEASDTEGLLVSFLTELIFAQESDNLGFDVFKIRVWDCKASGKLTGARLETLARPIKAVTYHNLGVSRSADGYETEIVFDV